MKPVQIKLLWNQQSARMSLGTQRFQRAARARGGLKGNWLIADASTLEALRTQAHPRLAELCRGFR